MYIDVACPKNLAPSIWMRYPHSYVTLLCQILMISSVEIILTTEFISLRRYILKFLKKLADFDHVNNW